MTDGRGGLATARGKGAVWLRPSVTGRPGAVGGGGGGGLFFEPSGLVPLLLKFFWLLRAAILSAKVLKRGSSTSAMMMVGDVWSAVKMWQYEADGVYKAYTSVHLPS